MLSGSPRITPYATAANLAGQGIGIPAGALRYAIASWRSLRAPRPGLLPPHNHQAQIVAREES